MLEYVTMSGSEKRSGSTSPSGMASRADRVDDTPEATRHSDAGAVGETSASPSVGACPHTPDASRAASTSSGHHDTPHPEPPSSLIARILPIRPASPPDPLARSTRVFSRRTNRSRPCVARRFLFQREFSDPCPTRPAAPPLPAPTRLSTAGLHSHSSDRSTRPPRPPAPPVRVSARQSLPANCLFRRRLRTL